MDLSIQTTRAVLTQLDCRMGIWELGSELRTVWFVVGAERAPSDFDAIARAELAIGASVERQRDGVHSKARTRSSISPLAGCFLDAHPTSIQQLQRYTCVLFGSDGVDSGEQASLTPCHELQHCLGARTSVGEDPNSFPRILTKWRKSFTGRRAQYNVGSKARNAECGRIGPFGSIDTGDRSTFGAVGAECGGELVAHKRERFLRRDQQGILVLELDSALAIQLTPIVRRPRRAVGGGLEDRKRRPRRSGCRVKVDQQDSVSQELLQTPPHR